MVLQGNLLPFRRFKNTCYSAHRLKRKVPLRRSSNPSIFENNVQMYLRQNKKMYRRIQWTEKAPLHQDRATPEVGSRGPTKTRVCWRVCSQYARMAIVRSISIHTRYAISDISQSVSQSVWCVPMILPTPARNKCGVGGSFVYRFPYQYQMTHM